MVPEWRNVEEFTKRAFLNKRIDLSQAEAVDDLIHSKTSDFAIQSAKNLSGRLAQKINEIKKIYLMLHQKLLQELIFLKMLRSQNIHI